MGEHAKGAVMSEKPYKLGQWFWGRLPELPPEAVIQCGGHGRDQRDLVLLTFRRQVAFWRLGIDGWWCIISDTDPLPPEPELSLHEGWRVTVDVPLLGPMHRLGVVTNDGKILHSSVLCERRTRAECVRVVQAAMDAMEGVK
jgi:hypothetical protein